MLNNDFYKYWVVQTKKAERKSHEIFSVVEGASSRVVHLNDLLKSTGNLPVDLKSYFEEALGCLEKGFIRAAIVMGWAGFFGVFVPYIFNNKEIEIRAKRAKWKFKDATELKENNSESQLLDVSKEVGIINKSQLRIYQGQLATRNQCAHPTLYQPSINEAIGFLDNMIKQVKNFI